MKTFEYHFLFTSERKSSVSPWYLWKCLKRKSIKTKQNKTKKSSVPFLERYLRLLGPENRPEKFVLFLFFFKMSLQYRSKYSLSNGISNCSTDCKSKIKISFPKFLLMGVNRKFKKFSAVWNLRKLKLLFSMLIN